MAVKPYIAELEEYVIDLRRHFHRHPELPLKETETAARIESELEAIGIAHERVGETGVIGILRGTKPSAIVPDSRPPRPAIVALRADIDALPIEETNDVEYRSRNPGVMHACGHDAHAASLLGAAKALHAKRAEFAGEIRLFFQQAEELGAGARQFIAAGKLDGVGALLGTHVASRLPIGTVAIAPGATNASCDFFRITVRGKSAHVSTPQDGVDAAYVAAKIVVDLQSIVARHTDPLDTVVVGVGVIKAGTSYNVIANEAIIEGTTRAFAQETRDRTNEAVGRIARAAAEAHGATAHTYFEHFAAPLVNDPDIAAEAQRVASGILGSDGVLTSLPKSLGADDFADYLPIVPGAYAMVGSRNESLPATASPHHHGTFDIDERALLIAANLYADFALDWLNAR